MRLLIIRHGDPDYIKDSLTETGWKEAEALSVRMAEFDSHFDTGNGKEDKNHAQEKEHVFYYVSPLGRARDTASCTLKKIGKEAVECDWLREFPLAAVKPRKPADETKPYAWDWYPADWTVRENFFDRDRWQDEEEMAEANAPQKYSYVIENFDRLLAEHGYQRNGAFYDAVRPNHDTLVFFCHFGLECVLLSRLLNVSPMILWHGTCGAPTSVTTIYTEEREEGKAYFRMAEFGDVSHLKAAGLLPSFSARFCECYADETRH